MRQGFFGRMILKGGLVLKQIFNAEKVILASFSCETAHLALRQNLKLLVKNYQLKK